MAIGFAQIAFNLKRWEELLGDKHIADLGFRMETDKLGGVILSPFPGGWHGALKCELGFHLKTLLGGTPVSECPISTSEGVKLADVGWYSLDRFAEVREDLDFSQAPEICVEVVSASDTVREMKRKRELNFEAGCKEFWTCGRNGVLQFSLTDSGSAVEKSVVCPGFPLEVTI